MKWSKRESLLADVAAAFPQITTLQYVINEKQNDTIYDQEIITYSGPGYIEEAMPKYRAVANYDLKSAQKAFTKRTLYKPMNSTK